MQIIQFLKKQEKNEQKKIFRKEYKVMYILSLCKNILLIYFLKHHFSISANIFSNIYKFSIGVKKKGI